MLGEIRPYALYVHEPAPSHTATYAMGLSQSNKLIRYAICTLKQTRTSGRHRQRGHGSRPRPDRR